jgi:DMSO/TMAO reductase YedYZ heme-binding membrane subunit
MSAYLNELLKNKMINGWNLFWLITAPISLAIVFTMTRVDLSSAEGVSSMIQLSVRCAVPWLFLAFAASSLQVVFPGPISRWLLRNRKNIGLCFAAAMAWQLTFILWLVGIHTEYYVNDVYVLSDVVEGFVGYALLIAMVLTSFRFGRSRLSPKQWRLLHTSGIYWLWVYAWSVYWFNLFYYESPAVLIDYFYYWGGLLAWGLRMLAWTNKRWKQSEAQAKTGGTGNLLFLASGVVAVVIGLTASSFGSAWNPQVYEYLFGFSVVESIDAFMPYFPFVPFYPIFIIMSGAFLIIKSRG